MSHPHGREPLPPSWVERHVGLIVKITVAVCVLLLVADVVFHFVGHKHVHFAIEAWPAFYAVVGFISYVGLVLTAKQLRKLVMRPLDFYGEAVPDPEPPSPELQPQQEEALARGLELEGEPQEVDGRPIKIIVETRVVAPQPTQYATHDAAAGK